MMAAAGEPGGPGEYRDFKVVKSYSAQDGDYRFHAFVIEWEGQEVVAMDSGSLIKARSDDIINVLVSRGLPREGQPLGRIMFLARPEKKPPLTRAQIDSAPAELRTAGEPSVLDQVRVTKVYALQNSSYMFRAYEVEWKGQEVILFEHGMNTTYDVGDTVTVRVHKSTFPDPNRPMRSMTFYISSPPRPPRASKARPSVLQGILGRE
jgi:hypothetical protein